MSFEPQPYEPQAHDPQSSGNSPDMGEMEPVATVYAEQASEPITEPVLESVPTFNYNASPYNSDDELSYETDVESDGPSGTVPSVRRSGFDGKSLLTGILLLVILAIGTYYRFTGQNWDDYTHLHPDERFLTGVATTLGGELSPSGDATKAQAQIAICKDRYPDTNGVATSIFDSLCSTMYPKNASSGTGLYVYGELPMYITVYLANLTKQVHLSEAQKTADPLDDRVAMSWTSYDGIHLVGRTVSAVVDIISIFFVFLIGRRLYNRWVGLMAAGCYAAAVLPIQLSHFFTMDVFTTLPVLIAFWFAVRVMDKGRWYDFVGFGLGTGAAMASRINAALLAGVVVLAAIVYVMPALDMSLNGSERRRLLTKAFGGVVLAGFVTIISFRILMPHAFLGGPGLMGFFDIGNQKAMDCINNPTNTGQPLDVAVVDCVHGGSALSDSNQAAPVFNPNPDSGGFMEKIAGKVFFQPWLDDLKAVANFSSGAVDFPPNHQWTSRTSYVFPARNIILWGLGLPLGLAGFIAWIAGLIIVIRARPSWTRHILTVIWILVYFGYMGRQWVMTMRYYALLYPFFILMASWGLYALVERSYLWFLKRPSTVRRLATFGATALLIVVVGGTFLWATMFVRIYQRQLTRVEASRWVMTNLPSAVAANLTMSDGRERLINMSIGGSLGINVTQFTTPNPVQMSFNVTSRAPIDRVTINHLLDMEGLGKAKKFNIAIAQNPDGSQPLATGSIEGIFSTSESPYGSAYPLILNQPIQLEPGQTYFLIAWTQDKLAVVRDDRTEPTDFIISNSNGDRLGQVRLPDSGANPSDGGGASASFADQAVGTSFKVPVDGTVGSLTFAHLTGVIAQQPNIEVTAKIMDDTQQLVGQGKLTADTTVKNVSALGASYTLKLDSPVQVQKDKTYNLQLTSSSPVQITGTVIAWEGDWDDPIPWKVCLLPPTMDLTHDSPSGANPVTCEGADGYGAGWYRGPKLNMAAEDDDSKRQAILSGLNAADYFIISSNRFYDSLARLPMRFPVSIEFYKALFNEQLGYDVFKTVASYPSLGSFEIADQNLPTYHSPAWMNEWESEEAFSVYDHPTVFIFKKNNNYSPDALKNVLYSVSNTATNEMDMSVVYPSTPKPDTKLINRITWSPKEATLAPTAYMLTPEQRTIQAQGGTWTDLFNRDWLINKNEVLAVIFWWLAIMLFGFAAWPLLFALLPGLPDRGYPIAKVAGLLIVAWIVWAGGTLKLLTWSQWGITLTLIGLAAVSVFVAWRQRAEFSEYVRINWRHMLIVEGITLLLFLAFVLVRLGNPDLWAQSLGGEKPMDFAYLNAVLKSTVFPPYDPWFSGGYLNYYYFGFVLVGTPVKMLGIVPSVAYNLIIPTLFALTGMGAFSVAFNLVASRWFFHREEGSEDGETGRERRRFALRSVSGSPYVAGIMALLLCMVLGNLDTPRVFITGVARAGGYAPDVNDMYQWKLQQFTTDNGRPPSQDEDLQLHEAAANPSPMDQLRFSMQDSQRTYSSLGQGLTSVFKGGALPIGPDRWFWGPRSIVGEIPGSSNEINEFPYFTFVFADLHAHMIALPLTLLALLWLLSEVLSAGYVMRPTWAAIGATMLGGLAVGTLQPSNTWDWVTYLLLAVLGLIFAAFLRHQKLGRRTLVALGAQLIGFFAAQWLFALPFTMFWSTAYLGKDAIVAFTGQKTPLWAYFDMHGLFLFIIFTYMLWQGISLLRRMYVRDLIGKGFIFLLVVLIVVASFGLGIALSVMKAKVSLLDAPIPLALLCIPVLGWCAVMFFMADQSRENRIFYALIGLAFGLTLGVEVVVLGADIGRQNTFFKFYMQIWVILSIMSGVALAWLFRAMERWHTVIKAPWLALLAVLLAAAAMFPLMSTQGKNAMRMALNAPHTLDGDAYMNYATYYEGPTAIPLADDLAIIHWLQDNAKGSPVILEGNMSEYKLGARISINTGLPTLIGWRFHQSQQRTIDPLSNMPWERIANIDALYTIQDIPTLWKMIQFFHIEYIVQGKLEQIVYGPQGQPQWEEMVRRGLLEVSFENNGDRIYHVIPGATLPSELVGG